MSRLSKIPLVAVVAAGVAFGGCGDDKKSSSSSSYDASPPSAAKSASSSATQTLRLTADPGGALTFDKKALTAKAGSVKLVMDNPKSSGLPHGIGVDGNGVDVDGETVDPGKTSTATADLKPGTYEFYCTVDAHQQAGMKGKLTVR